MAKQNKLTEENNFKNTSLERSEKDTKIGDAIANAFVSDNPYMAILDIATMGTFGGVGGKGALKHFLTKSPRGMRLVQKMPFLSKLTEKVVSPKNKGFDFNKVKEFNKTVKSEIKAKGLVAEGVSNPQKFPQEVIDNNLRINKQFRYGDPDATVYPAIKNRKELQDMTNQIKRGHQDKFKQMESDMPNFNTGQLSQKNVKNLGSNESGQTIYEVTFPNGSKQKFWASTGTGQKSVKLSEKNKHLNAKNSKGYFGPVMGHIDGSKAGFSNSWFVKADGWERGYGSMMIEDTQIWLKSLNDAGKLPK